MIYLWMQLEMKLMVIQVLRNLTSKRKKLNVHVNTR